jgi:hypothetical protein
MKPGKLVKAVNSAIPYIFNLYDLKLASRMYNVRPQKWSSDKTQTRADFCIYDEPNDSYLYTPAFVSYLTGKCSDATGFKEATGREPKLKI